jgi:hypothetical protein
LRAHERHASFDTQCSALRQSTAQGVDALLLFQAPAHVDYFVEICNRTFTTAAPAP